MSAERIRFNGSSIPDDYRAAHIDASTKLPTPEAQVAQWMLETIVPGGAAEQGLAIVDNLSRRPGFDYGHETFLLERSPRREGWEREDYPYGFDFCKTARKPYDQVVTAVLILCERFCPNWRDITSDGTPADWEPALELCLRLFGPDWRLRLPAGVR